MEWGGQLLRQKWAWVSVTARMCLGTVENEEVPRHPLVWFMGGEERGLAGADRDAKVRAQGSAGCGLFSFPHPPRNLLVAILITLQI